MEAVPDHGNDPTAKCYVFITSNIGNDPRSTGRAIAETLAGHNIWLARVYMPHIRSYGSGDRVVFYAGGERGRFFLGDATIDGPPSPMTSEDVQLARTMHLSDFALRIPLRDVALWDRQLELKPLVPLLTFVANKAWYGGIFRRASLKIPQNDFEVILRKAGRGAPR